MTTTLTTAKIRQKEVIRLHESERLRFHWPSPREGRVKATHSLQYTSDLERPFRGPISPCNILPTSTRCAANSGPGINASVVSVGKFLAQGRVWSAFTASSDKGHALVAKFTSPDVHHMRVSDLRSEIVREAWVYDHIWKLQGTVVPSFYGIYESSQPHSISVSGYVRMLCALLDSAGDAITGSMIQRMRESDKLKIVEKYEQLHDAGIVHVSHSPKHWIKRYGQPMQTMRLIDFGCSHVSLASVNDDAPPPGIRLLPHWEFEERAAAEMAYVESRLGLNT